MELLLKCVKIIIYKVAGFIVLVFDPNWMCRIHDNTEYGWVDGIWHGFMWLHHLIRNIFIDTNIISHNGSTMYYVCFCLSPIYTIIILCNFFKGCSLTEDDRKRMHLDDEERRLRLVSTKKERMHNALKKKVSKWLSEIEVGSGKSPMPPGTLDFPVLSPVIRVNTDNSIDISDLITSQVLNFVLEKNEEEYSLKELNIKDLHYILSSTLLEHGINCNDEEVVDLADMLVSYIDESIKASKKLYDK